VSTALLITTAVVLACVVSGFAINTMQQTVNPNTNPQIGQVKDLQNLLLNQTNSLFNETTPEIPLPPN
jgi:hypothetical protein